MKNLHLMPMDSTFTDSMVSILNRSFPQAENDFVLETKREKLADTANCTVDPSAFSAEYLNRVHPNYSRIILQSMFLSPDALLHLSDEAAKKLVWIVWGHDLYTVHKPKKRTLKTCWKEAVHCGKKLLRGTYFRQWKKQRALRAKVSKFRCIGIAFPYDEKMIRKKYGKKVPVVYGPVMSGSTTAQYWQLRRDRLRRKQAGNSAEPIRILVGHSGFDFLEHEKYLQKLARYQDENIHIYMILCYGASPEKIERLTRLAVGIFGPEKVTVQTEMTPVEEYNAFLSEIDIAIFPFRHQSALGNAKRMAFMGIKLYFDPRGVLAKGFRAGGVKTYDCRRIGRISFAAFSKPAEAPDVHAELFRSYDPKNKEMGVEAWKHILCD